jgi:hypothetical protein
MAILKAAILYIIQESEPKRFALLKESLYSLHYYFNREYRYPILLFHENLSDEQKKELAIFDSVECIHVKPNAQCHPSFLHGLMFHSSLTPYDYYWKLSEGSCLLEKVSYDPFKKMEEQTAIYGYRSVSPKKRGDDHHRLHLLWETTRDFARDNSLPLSHFKQLMTNWRGRYRGYSFYAPFEINKISFWRNHELYKKYLEKVNKLDGFNQYGWEDAIACSLSIGLFLNSCQLYHFRDIAFRHQHDYSIPGKTGLIFSREGNPFQK